jgi:indolepyruvate ferredoxin oxidoreductase
MAGQDPQFSLSDRYLIENGTIYLNGLQAMVRLPLDVARRDRRAGRQTASLITGYEGSPLAGYDLELARWQGLLTDQQIVFRPALNEELAANAVMGSQLASASSRRTNDGVVGYWYGKAPGRDRATDALRHGNLGGAHPDGGALVFVGDDSVAKSSTVPSSSEMALAELGLPVLSPSNPQDVLDLGVHGVEMSRFSGLWVGMKIATNVADGGATTHVAIDRVTPVRPDDHIGGRRYEHEVSAQFLQPTLARLEHSLLNERLDLARRYSVANGLNPVTGAGSGARVGIIVSGMSYLDVKQALGELGLDDADLDRLGVRILKLGMVYPLDRGEIRSFAEGLAEIIVVEEKRSFIEAGVKEILYRQPGAPAVSGKKTPQDEPLLRADADLTPEIIAAALGQRLSLHMELPVLVETPVATRPPLPSPLPLLQRTAYFCSGCPHSRSTRTPETSLVGGGIGCHTMVISMPRSRTGTLIGFAQMGGEGASWLGMEPFVADEHLIQNLGDGTFHHSGSLAIRAAVAAKSHITYRLLYNSAVAMTGGQTPVGVMTVPKIADVLLAEGVQRIAITTEDPRRYRKVSLPSGVRVYHRDDAEKVQRELAKVPGVTVLIHDQECATELRRKRKRGILPEPPERAYINQRVCEGCGDCGQKSNCLSVEPVATEYGRKTRIHQSSCNKDYSCLQGDCPSFISVVPAPSAKAAPRPVVPSISGAILPLPLPGSERNDFNIRLTGIGGTGVVTTAQIIAMAAVAGGRFVQSLDQTGLSQKGGAVVSDVRICTMPVEQANKVGAGQADLYLGCDLLVAAQPTNLSAASPIRTIAVVSTSQTPTGSMITDPSITYPNTIDTEHQISAMTIAERSTYVDARQLSLDLFDDDHYANILLVGIAVQSGALPLDPALLERAITLNGVAVDRNIQAFRRGRQWVADPEAVHGEIASIQAPPVLPVVHPKSADIAEAVRANPDSELATLVLARTNDLIGYQNAAYATRYAAAIEQVRAAEAAIDPDSTRLARAVAQYLHKVMAYKDEYEVARLSVDPLLAADLQAQFGPGYRINYQLQPPILRAFGLKRKINVNGAFQPVFELLYAMRWLRRTPLDPFRHAKVRRTERRLIREYRSTIEAVLRDLTAANLDSAIAIAELPDMIRGYEDIKLESVTRYRVARAELLEEFTTPMAVDPILV